MCTMDNGQDIPSGSGLIFLWNYNSVFHKLFSTSLKNMGACDQSFRLQYYIMYFTPGQTESFEGNKWAQQ